MTDIRRRNKTLVQSTRSRTWVAWWGHQLPAGIKIGAEVIVWGKMMTFGNARSFQIIDSVVIKGISGVEIAKALAKILKDHIVQPPDLPSQGNTQPNGRDGVA